MSSDPGLYVAVVGGDESVRRSLVRLLQQAGFHPVSFSTLEEFLAGARQFPFGCLLMNSGLSAMKPSEVQQKLQQAGVQLPVIYITSHDDPATKEDALRSGCAGFFRITDAGPDIIEAIRRAHHPPGP
jgi:FixJ family two-component response regulator